METELTLGQKQKLFTRLVVQLIDEAHKLGYEITFGEAWRPPETAKLYAEQGKGTANSLHCDKLAIDLNLFKDGVYLDKTEDHIPLGIYWKSLSSLCRWGGDFKDGNHYSIFHAGRA